MILHHEMWPLWGPVYTIPPPLPPAACVCETERWGSFGNHVTKSSFCMYTILLNECSALGWMNTTFLSPDCFIVFDHCPLQLSLAALDSIAHFRIVFHRWEKWMNNCSDAIMALLYTTVSTNLLHYEYLGQKQWWWLRAILFLETQYCCQTKFYHQGAWVTIFLKFKTRALL